MERTLTIKMNSQSAADLNDLDWALYVFQAVQYGQPAGSRVLAIGAGYSLVWAKMQSFFESNSVMMASELSVYVSDSEIKNNAVIKPRSTLATGLGQIVKVDNNGGLTGSTNGRDNVVSIENTGTTQWATGLSMTDGNDTTPTCAFPLYGFNQLMITSVPNVLVMMAADVTEVGIAVSTAWNAGLFIEFDSASARDVTYDINTSWSADGATWATSVAANQDIASLLVVPSNA